MAWRTPPHIFRPIFRAQKSPRLAAGWGKGLAESLLGRRGEVWIGLHAMFANVETSYLLFSTYTDTSKEGPNN